MRTASMMAPDELRAHLAQQAASERATSNPAGPAPVVAAVSTGSASGPRVRCSASSRSHFFGRYKKHDIEVWCYNKRRIWSFRVTGPDGIDAANGAMRHPGTKREAIIYALTGALLWPNTKLTGAPRPV